MVISGLGALTAGPCCRLADPHHGNQRHPGAAALSRCNDRGAPTSRLSSRPFGHAMVLMNYSKSLVEGFAFLSKMVTAANLPLYLGAALGLVLLARRGGRPASLGLVGPWPRYGLCAVRVMASAASLFLWGLVLAAAGLPVTCSSAESCRAATLVSLKFDWRMDPVATSPRGDGRRELRQATGAVAPRTAGRRSWLIMRAGCPS